MDDVEVHETLYAGDPADRERACTAISNRYAPWLVAALEKKGLPYEFADHGACQAIYRLIEHLSTNGSFKSADSGVVRRWLYKVGRDAGIDEMRKIWRLRSGADTFNLSEFGGEEDANLDHEDTSGGSAIDVAAARELCLELWQCIQELKPDEKFVLLRDMRVLTALREYGGWETDLYNEDLAADAGAGVALPSSLETKRLRVLKKLLAKIGRSTNG